MTTFEELRDKYDALNTDHDQLITESGRLKEQIYELQREVNPCDVSVRVRPGVMAWFPTDQGVIYLDPDRRESLAFLSAMTVWQRRVFQAALTYWQEQILAIEEG